MKKSLLVLLTIFAYSFVTNAQQLSSLQEKKKIDFSFYPNPATTEINVNLVNNSGESFTIGIYNAIGDLVYSKPIHQSETTESLKINLSNFQRGMYIIQLNGKDQKLTHKLIVK